MVSFAGTFVTLDESAFVNGICKPGTPIDECGRVCNGSEAVGLVISVTRVEDPRCTILVEGEISLRKVERQSGMRLRQDTKNALERAGISFKP